MLFYTYVWLREDDTPYYVGKGKGNRAYIGHRECGVFKAPPRGRIVFYIACDEQDAFETEKLLIWYYGRKDLGTGCLRNLTDGGDGVCGIRKIPCSPELRETRRRNALGKKHSKETRQKIAEINVAKRLRQTRCKNGHELVPENVYTTKNGTKRCRTCLKNYGTEYCQKNLEKFKIKARERSARANRPRKRIYTFFDDGSRSWQSA